MVQDGAWLLGRFAPWLRTIVKAPPAKAILRFAKKLIQQTAATTLCWVDGGFVIKPSGWRNLIAPEIHHVLHIAWPSPLRFSFFHPVFPRYKLAGEFGAGKRDLERSSDSTTGRFSSACPGIYRPFRQIAGSSGKGCCCQWHRSATVLNHDRSRNAMGSLAAGARSSCIRR